MPDPISAAIEIGKAVVGVAGTAAGAAEAVGTAGSAVAAGAEVAKVAQVAGEVTGVIEAIPNVTAAKEVSQLATQAASSPDLSAGENAIRKLTEFPDELGLSKEASQVVSVDIDKPVELTTDQEITATRKLETDLQRWDAEHPPPDQKTNPEGYKKWCEDRWEAETDYIAKAKTDVTMAGWDKEHPEPDRIREPEKHAEWQKERAKQENSLKEKFKTEAKNMK